MLKIFRNIRQNLLNEGKTTRYFKYAIGEIVLVVIGILIALSINNWNERQKGLKWQHNFLIELSMELQDNHEQLQKAFEVQSKRIKACKTINTLIDTKDEANKHSIDSLFNLMQESNRTFFPTTGVYDLGLASGKLENLQNETLKYAIMNLYNHYYKRLVYNGELQDKAEDVIDWEKRKYYDIGAERMKSWAHIMDPDFNDQILFILEQTGIYNRLVEDNLNQISSLIEMTKNEIKKP
jgi:hypothetical protein